VIGHAHRFTTIIWACEDDETASDGDPWHHARSVHASPTDISARFPTPAIAALGAGALGAGLSGAGVALQRVVGRARSGD